MNRTKYIAVLMIVIAFASAGLTVNRYLDDLDMIDSIPQFCQEQQFIRNTPILIEYQQQYDNTVNNITFPKEDVMLKLPILVKCDEDIFNASNYTKCSFYDYMIEFNKINSTETTIGANCTLTCEDDPNSIISFTQRTDWNNNELYTYFQCTKFDYYDTGIYLDPSKLECSEDTPDKEDCDEALVKAYGGQLFCFANENRFYDLKFASDNPAELLSFMMLGDERRYYRSFLFIELENWFELKDWMKSVCGNDSNCIIE